MYLVLLSIVVTIFLGHWISSIQYSSRKMPPGPFVMPFGLGCVFSILWRFPRLLNLASFRPWEMYDNLSKEFGNIYSTSFLGLNCVILSSYELLTEVAHMDEYSTKYSSERYTYSRSFGKELGLIGASSTHLWTEMRSFTMRTLRGFGYAKHGMHCVIVEEANLLAETFEKSLNDKSGLRIHLNFAIPALNVIWNMVTGTRYAHDDPKAVGMMNKLFELSKIISFGSPIEVVLPFVKDYAPWALPALKPAERYQIFEDWHAFSKEIITERKTAGVYLSEPQNFVDLFLQKIDDSQNDPNSLYTQEQLQVMIEDLMMGGSLTTNDTLSFAILYLILNPEMQAQIQKEIDAVTDSVPALEDIKRMPFFQAFILETHRCACIAPNPGVRITPKTWNLRGYHIPKGTLILSNHYGINFSKEIWGDPNTFRPDRFIKNGEFVPDPRVVIFGFGKRICMGVNLVDSLIPVFLGTLLQRFKLSVVPGTEAPTTVPESGATLSPQPFQVLVTRRQ